jgi:hypothetical protein
MLRLRRLVAVAVAAGCAAGAVGVVSSAGAGGCSRYTQPATPHRAGFTRAQVKQAFAKQGFELSWSGLSYAFPGEQAIRCHSMLADELLYSASSAGPCLFVYLFPWRLSRASVRRLAASNGPCGDGPPVAGLRSGVRAAGSIWVLYRLAPAEVRRMKAAVKRLSGR